MARILEHWRVLGATLFSLALISGATYLVRDAEFPRSAHASTESDLLKAIASKDSDGDGLPDWEESLYGTDLNKIDSFNLGMPDGQAVAKGLIVPKAVANLPIQITPDGGTSFDPSIPSIPEKGLTTTLVQYLYTAYRTARDANGGADLTDAQTQDIVTTVLADFSKTVVASPDFMSRSDLSISGSGPGALRAYAVAVEAVLKKNTETASSSELEYLAQALNGGDDGALAQIASISKVYRNSAVGIAKLPVPQEIAGEMLRTINAFARLGDITSDFARVRVDPLATMLSLPQYSETMLAVANAFIDIHLVYTTAGVTLAKGSPGASFVNMMSDIHVTQGRQAE